MIVLTGANGFIGSHLAEKLYAMGEELILIDKFCSTHNYIENLWGAYLLNFDEMASFLEENKSRVKYFIHLGANSNTDQNNLSDSINTNISSSQYIWNYCSEQKIPLIYASSAATYGNGSGSFSDRLDSDQLKKIKQTSLYSWTKMYFDLFSIESSKKGYSPSFWAGLKFFNVYGVNEFHKGSQSSVLHTFTDQIIRENKICLFKSHKEGVEDGKQIRDFVSVNYCTDFIINMMNAPQDAHDNGLYNVGTGKGKTFLDFVSDFTKSLNIDPKIEFVDTPLKLQKHYQYYTQADTDKSKKIYDYNSFDYHQDLSDISTRIFNYYKQT